MQNLPKGYYAVVALAEGEALPTQFAYKGQTYAVTPEQNVFSSLHQAMEAANEAPEAELVGLHNTDLSAPVVLFSAGTHLVEKFFFTKSLTLLGQSAGISPNLPNGEGLPAENPAFFEGQSYVMGSFWHGKLWAQDPAVRQITLDGFTTQDIRLVDTRQEGDYKITVKNVNHVGPCGWCLYKFAEGKGNLHREITFQNIRLVDFDGLGYGNNFLELHGQKVSLQGLCVSNTAQLFGFTNIPKSVSTGDGQMEIKDSYFAHFGGENGIANTCACPETARFDFLIENCTFQDASRAEESPLQPHLPNPNCRLTVKNCRFRDSRGNKAAITLRGDRQNVTLSDCVFEGFDQPVAEAAAIPLLAPDFIKADPHTTDCADPHQVVAGDFSALEKFYAGRKAYYGDQHVHTDCGGTSDGHYPMADWPAEMDRLQLDFAAVVDHRQMRGFFLPEWDEERFIIGTEPATRIKDIDCPYGKESIYTSIHYNMLFPHKYGLAMVLANFPEFQFSGNEVNGSFSYARFTKAELENLFQYVTSIGGLMVHPHPKAMLTSENPLDYYFGEGMFLETLYEAYDSNYSFKNYELWVELLRLGKKVFTSAGSDTHQNPTNAVVSTFYTKERSGRAFFDQMKTADYAVGAFGMQMLIDNTPMGGEVAYQAGQTLLLRVGDAFGPALRENTAYELRIYTDRGLAYAGTWSGKNAQTVALQVQNRKFYRAEVVDLTHNYRIGIGNPIWLV